jgi:hypothetical protein
MTRSLLNAQIRFFYGLCDKGHDSDQEINQSTFMGLMYRNTTNHRPESHWTLNRGSISPRSARWAGVTFHRSRGMGRMMGASHRELVEFGIVDYHGLVIRAEVVLSQCQKERNHGALIPSV